MAGYFYTFKNNFAWEDKERKIILCDLRLRYSADHSEYLATVTICLDSKVFCLNKGHINIHMPEKNFRDFIFKAAERWNEKQESSSR